MQNLTNTQYEITIKVKYKRLFFVRYTRSILLKFNEASTTDGLEFISIAESKDGRILEYVHQFLEEATGREISKREFQQVFLSNVDQVMRILKTTRFKSIFTYSKKVDLKKKMAEDGDIDKKPKSLEDQIWDLTAFLSEPMSKDPKFILNNYTFGELSFWAAKYIYRENQKTEEGRKLNEKTENDAYFEENRENIEKQLEAVDLYLKKKESWKSN